MRKVEARVAVARAGKAWCVAVAWMRRKKRVQISVRLPILTLVLTLTLTLT